MKLMKWLGSGYTNKGLRAALCGGSGEERTESKSVSSQQRLEACVPCSFGEEMGIEPGFYLVGFVIE